MLDRRMDLPGAEARAKRGVGFMVGAIVVLPLLPPLAFLFMYLGVRNHGYLNPDRQPYRVSYRVRQRRKLVAVLVYVWSAEFIAFLWIDELWPPFMDWVGFGA